jgi:hypothetical protein
MGNDQRRVIGKFLKKEPRAAEKIDVGVEIGKHVDLRIVAEQPRHERRCQRKVIFDGGPLALCRDQRIVGGFEGLKTHWFKVGEGKSARRFIALIAEAKEPKAEGTAVAAH